MLDRHVVVFELLRLVLGLVQKRHGPPAEARLGAARNLRQPLDALFEVARRALSDRRPPRWTSGAPTPPSCSRIAISDVLGNHLRIAALHRAIRPRCAALPGSSSSIGPFAWRVSIIVRGLPTHSYRSHPPPRARGKPGTLRAESQIKSARGRSSPPHSGTPKQSGQAELAAGVQVPALAAHRPTTGRRSEGTTCPQTAVKKSSEQYAGHDRVDRFAVGSGEASARSPTSQPPKHAVSSARRRSRVELHCDVTPRPFSRLSATCCRSAALHCQASDRRRHHVASGQSPEARRALQKVASAAC